VNGLFTGILILPGIISDDNQTRLIASITYLQALNTIDTTITPDIDLTGHPE